MPVLIDGNNLLFGARAVQDDGPLIGRSILCDVLGEWARRCRERVHVVFDGPAPAPGLAMQIGNPHIQVSYSGDVSADAKLLRLLREDSAARRLLVVSTDREVAQAATMHRARSVRSENFWIAVRRDLARPPPERIEPEEKQLGLSPDQTEQWLREFGFDDAE